MNKFINFFEPSFNDLKDSISFIKNIESSNVNEINSHAVDFLNLLALVAVGFTWLQFIEISLNKIKHKEDDFYISKMQLGEFYLSKVIFETKKYKNNIYTSGNLYNNFADKNFESSIQK